MARVDFTSQEYFRNPAASLERLRDQGPVVEVRFNRGGKSRFDLLPHRRELGVELTRDVLVAHQPNLPVM